MNNINIANREMTAQEFARMNKGFEEHAIDNHVAVQDADRLGFVAMDGNTFVGCSSGLAYKNGETYSVR